MALDELGRQGDLRLLDLAADVRLRNGAGWTPGMARALEHLGDKAVSPKLLVIWGPKWWMTCGNGES
jgi:hypothetical protein